MILAETSLIQSVKELVNVLCQPHWFLILSVIGLVVFLKGYRTFTQPKIAAPFGVFCILVFLASCLDANFVQIVTKADNVPIMMMMFFVGFFIWLAFRQAAINDERSEKGEPLLEAGADDKVLVWPDLVYTELICLILATAALTVWAILLRAPLEQPADPNVAPNPAKAPWYFLGLQEMLVYFDPWLAGVLLPGLIIVGLIAVPYMDKNPRGNGYYTFKERPFALTTFLFGFLILWVVLIIFGTFLRGPNWNFFGPYEYWDPHRPAALLNTEFHDLFWIGIMGRALPEHFLVRELPGIVLVLGYFAMGPPLLMLFFRKLYRQIGFLRYSMMSFLLLVMLLMPIKMVLRWTLNLHYIVGITEWFLNV
ncbi:MAG: cytochrome C [Planctomycetota bacterium]